MTRELLIQVFVSKNDGPTAAPRPGLGADAPLRYSTEARLNRTNLGKAVEPIHSTQQHIAS